MLPIVELQRASSPSAPSPPLAKPALPEPPPPAAPPLEPDECYVLGSNPEPERPDLAIEVIWKSGSIDKLEIYRKLRVREVWIWRKGAIGVYGLQNEAYQRLEQSEVIPGISLEQLLAFASVHPMTQAVREYRAALRGE